MVMLGIVYLLGIMLCSTGKSIYAIIFVALFSCLCFGMISHRRWKKLALWSLVALSVFSVSCVRYQRESSKREAYLTRIYDGETITVWGEVYRKELKNGSCNVYISKSAVDFGEGTLPCNDVLVYLDSDDCSIGDVLKVSGKFKAFAVAVNEGEFDLKQFYLSQKIDMAVKAEQCSVLADGGFAIGEFHYGQWLYEKRCALVESFGTITDEVTSGILSSMILGDKTMMDADVKSLYQASGISHILAISGLHISIIGAGLYRILRKRGRSFCTSMICADIVILAYGFMTGNAISTQRAVCMFLVMTFGNTLGRSYDMLNALGMAVLIILIDNPFAVGYAGFVFSVVAILAIGIAVPGFAGKSSSDKKCRLRTSALSGLAIQLVTLPIVSFYYYEIPGYAVFLNLIILPLLNVLFVSGLAAALTGLKCIWLAKIMVIPAKIILSFYEAMCSLTMKLPCSQIIVGKPAMGKFLIYYAVLGAGLFILKILGKKDKTACMKLARASLTGLLCLILVSHKKTGFEIDMLDVGQGDGIYISTNENYNLFIDGGSTSKSSLGKYTILPFLKAKGVRKIDYWFISHADKDHISAIEDVLESGYRAECFVIAESALEDEAMENLARQIESYGSNIILMKRDDIIDFGETSIRCIYPVQGEGGDRNDISLSFVYQDHEFKGIFCGDISGGVENRILDECDKSLIQNVDLYKVNHHGSKYSSTREWLDTLNPHVSVISCGEKNMYGHPSEEAIERIAEFGSEIYITMDSGQITIRKNKGLLQVKGFTSN